jgi:hypothetical protein
MADAHPNISDLIIDCADVWLKRENGLGMGFQQVAEPKVGKNRVDFDFASQDPAAEQRRVESLGGQRLKGYETGGFLVMADPEGNEFCIIPKDPFELDDAGRTSYLNNQDLPPKRL